MPFSIRGVHVWFLHCCPSLASTWPLSFKSSFLSLSLTPCFLPIEADLEYGRQNLNFKPTFVEGSWNISSVCHRFIPWITLAQLSTLTSIKEEIRRLQQLLLFLQRQTCDKHCEIIDGESKLSCDHATINTQHIFGKYHGTKMNRRCQASNYVCSFIQ